MLSEIIIIRDKICNNLKEKLHFSPMNMLYLWNTGRKLCIACIHHRLMKQKPKSLKISLKEERRHVTMSVTFDQCYSAGKLPANLPEKMLIRKPTKTTRHLRVILQRQKRDLEFNNCQKFLNPTQC